MSQELLRDVLELAGRLPAATRSPALCHLARVLTKSDPAEARRVLEEGLALAADLPDKETRDILLGEGAVLAATIAPARAFEILSTLEQDARAAAAGQVVARLVDHGFRDEAVDYLLQAPLDAEFDFGMLLRVVGPLQDPDIKRRVLRRAIAAMREADQGRRHNRGFDAHHFVQFFLFSWRLLPTEEARAALHEHVQRILSEPDSPMNSGFGAGSINLALRSRHQHALFEILEALQELAPDLAAAVIPRYPDLAAAAWRFPYGRRSLTEEMEKEAAAAAATAPAPADVCMDYVHVGGFVPIDEALRTQFAASFAAAMDEYESDVDPEDANEAPQQCWPSAAAFRTILHKAGQYEGPAAARYLDRIPDPTLRLFAQIELAAALAGLPQLGSTTMRRGAAGRRRSARAAAAGPLAPSDIPAGMRPLPPARKPDLPPSRELRVSPATASADQGMSGGSGSDFVEIRNAPLASVVSHLFAMPAARIAWPPSIDPAARYDFVLVLAQPVPDDERARLVRDGITSHVKLRMSVEERPADVWVLTAPNGIKARARRRSSMMGGLGSMGFSEVGVSSSQTSGTPRMPDAVRLQEILRSEDRVREADPEAALGRMQREAARSLAAMAHDGASISGIHGEFTIGELCALLEPGLGRPLVDETNLGGRYAIRFESDEPGRFVPALVDRLGLQLSQGRRAVPMLVVYEDLR